MIKARNAAPLIGLGFGVWGLVETFHFLEAHSATLGGERAGSSIHCCGD